MRRTGSSEDPNEVMADSDGKLDYDVRTRTRRLWRTLAVLFEVWYGRDNEVNIS